ncbi:unnamed protein product [Symbiodinium sp. CCMP2592]|nr:unnamed protein product [Symbiodinium sp. CCMP2592]
MQQDWPIMQARSEEGQDTYGQEPRRGQRRAAARQAHIARRRGPEKQVGKDTTDEKPKLERAGGLGPKDATPERSRQGGKSGENKGEEDVRKEESGDGGATQRGEGGGEEATQATGVVGKKPSHGRSTGAQAGRRRRKEKDVIGERQSGGGEETTGAAKQQPTANASGSKIQNCSRQEDKEEVGRRGIQAGRKGERKKRREMALSPHGGGVVAGRWVLLDGDIPVLVPRRYFPDAKGKPNLSRAASDGEMGGRAGRPIGRTMSKDWEERARLKEKSEVAMLPIPEKTDQKHSVSFGGIHQDTVEIVETDMTGKMSSVRVGKSTRTASRVSKGSNANKVAQIKTIRCSVEREEAFSQLRQNQMGERYGKKGTFGSREKIIATVTVAVHSAWLEWCTLMFTVLSAVLVGWEVDRGVETGADMHFALVFFKHLTTFVFLLEIAARITAQGKEFFNPSGDDIGWHILEVIMVAAGLIEFIVDCAGLAGEAGFLVVVRIGRAARLLRIHRVLHQVPALRMIYHSMLATTRSLFWAIAMLLIVIYCFAIVFQQAVNDYTGSQSQDDISETFGLFFPSILSSWLTSVVNCG